jgi:hypothetical protein
MSRFVLELALARYYRRDANPQRSARRVLARYDADRQSDALAEAEAEIARAIDRCRAESPDTEAMRSRRLGMRAAERVVRGVREEIEEAGEKGSRVADDTPLFFQPGRTYQRRRWQFQCLAVGPAPHDGQVRAVGFIGRPNETAAVHGMTRENWENEGWTEITEGGDD